MTNTLSFLIPTSPREISLLTLTQQVELAKAASSAYYNSDSPFLSDELFDTVIEAITTIDPEHSILIHVGTPPKEAGSKIKHLIPMFSLVKVNTEGELHKWAGTIETEWIVEPKGDGSSVALEYRFGKFTTATSRGDGFFGEDVTPNISKCGIPLSIPEWAEYETVSVRGEAVLEHTNWKIVDPDTSTNPRNVGNGIVRRQSDTSQGHLLTFLAFDVASPNTGMFEFTEQANLEALSRAGFTAIEAVLVPATLLMHALDTLRDRRRTMAYDIDGAVIKPNRIKVGKDLGISSGKPRGQRAFKWKSETALTSVISAIITTGHTGVLVPTISLQPVFLGGVIVKSALANNFAELARFNLHEGDIVEVVRSGEIVPKLVSVYSRSNAGKLIETPTCCPVCSGEVGHRTNVGGEDSVNLYCLNDDCDAKATGKVKRWLKSLDILGIGDDVRNHLAASGMVKTIPDLYRLTPAALAGIPMGKGRVGDSRAANIVKNIQARRKLTLVEVLGSLGITDLGKRRVEIIIETAISRLGDKSLTKLAAWTDQDTIPQLAEQLSISAIAPGIVKWFTTNEELLADLLTVVTIVSPEDTPSNPRKTAKPSALNGKRVVLTGSMSRKRSAIELDISEAGGIPEDKVSKLTNILVAADPNSGSSKLKKAKDSGIEVISEEALMILLASASDHDSTPHSPPYV